MVVEYDPDTVREDLRTLPVAERVTRGLWRWAPFLPVQGVPADYAADVGGTPIVRHDRLSASLGVEVLLKNEGTNPSGSFKDRGLAVAVALGAACGAGRFALPTQGNAGVAACLFSARLGLPGCLVWMPDGYEGSVYHRACELFGGEVHFFGPNIAAAGRNMRETLAAPLAGGEIVDLSTFFEPGRLEGKKTMGLEIAEHFGADLPDVVVYPTGGGTGLVGIWKAFEELDRARAHSTAPAARCRAWSPSSRPTALRSWRRSGADSTRSSQSPRRAPSPTASTSPARSWATPCCACCATRAAPRWR